MKRLITALALLALAGCVTQPQKPQNLAEYKAMSERVYVGKTAEEVMSAAEQVIRLADDDNEDVTVVYADDEITIQRKFNAYMVLGSIFATYTFDIKTVTDANGVKTALKISYISASGMIPITHTATQLVFPATYELYFSRMDYLLGESDTWLTCSEAKKQFNGKGPLDGLCFMAEDKTPQGE